MYNSKHDIVVSRRSFVASCALVASSLAFANVLAGCQPAVSTKEASLMAQVKAKEAGARLFTDSCGRQVALAETVQSVAPSGPYAQVMLLQLVPDRLVGLSSSLSERQLKYFPAVLAGLPVFGKLYGGKNADMNFEEIVKADPDVILDVGEAKTDIVADLDDVQEQTGLPVVFVQATLGDLPEAYRTLGDVFGVSDRAEKLAQWVEDAFSLAAKHRDAVRADGLRVVYSTGEYGLDVKQAGSVHNAVLAAVGVDDIGEVQASGQGEVSIEQMLSWDPDVVILSPNSYYPDIYDDAVWQEASAVKNKRVYEVPAEPYSWIDQPPSAQQALGVLWLGDLLYPDLYDIDIVQAAREYYSLFWGYDLADEQARILLANSSLK